MLRRSILLVVLAACSSPQAEEPDWHQQRRRFSIGGASKEDCRNYIQPLLEREGIPYVPWSQDLGLVDFGSDTPENVRRARARIRRDAEARGYRFYPSPDTP